jgi:predicted peroxiredoxin
MVEGVKMLNKKKKDKIKKHEKWNKAVDDVLNKLKIDDMRADLIRNILSKKIVTKTVENLENDEVKENE